MNTTTRATRATEIVLPGKVDPTGLQTRTRDLPTPTAGQVILRMDATGVSFAEQQMRRGKYYDQPPFPFVPGYDIVGTVTAVGPDVDTTLIGHRFAAVTKTGAWASALLLEAADLIPVPDGVTAAAAETLVVNGITAWQMLHRTARVPTGATIVVLGANGGVGSTLVQLARHAGIRVIGTASARHHDRVRELGATPVDYHQPDMYQRIHHLAPHGVHAVFDHVGGAGLTQSWRLLHRGGVLVSYGTAATKNHDGNSQLPILKSFARLALWNALPNGKTAHFYNFWAGKRHLTNFRNRLREDLTHVLALLDQGVLTPQIAAQFPLADTSAALALAESHTTTGKIIITP